MMGALAFVWTYWLLASVVLGGLVVQWLTLWVPGTGLRGVGRTLLALWMFTLVGLPALAWFEQTAPWGVQRAVCVAVALGLAVAVVWVRPGEADGRAERPTTAPRKG